VKVLSVLDPKHSLDLSETDEVRQRIQTISSVTKPDTSFLTEIDQN